ncbi:MAG: DUF2339 domain-containing protein [Pseudomonadota bacterium]
MTHIVGWIVVLALIGGANWGLSGLLTGGAAGWLLGLLVFNKEQKMFGERLRKELQPLADRVAELEQKLAGPGNRGHQDANSTGQQTREDPGVEAPEPLVTTPVLSTDTDQTPPTIEPVMQQADTVVASDNMKAGDGWAKSGGGLRAERPAFIEKIFSFFSGGNLVVRVGVVVLFFGVAFLMRYAAERNLVPVELRLAAIALAAIVVLVIGWRLRERPGHYGLVLQGGAIGVLYLTVYGAAKLYGLLPMGLAFVLMASIVALSALLAVLQNARSLALFGSAGGFLAPVLASTGSGSHVALFSYYALLNAGILTIAWYRSWRELNLLGFVFTFVIGSAWGYNYYRPEHFSTTEPFLILFFLMYAMIAVLFATRQPPQLHGYVDGSLVFGVPIVAFALQAALVRDFEYGMAISALAVAGFYVGLASLLWRRSGEGLRMLTEAFLALGVVFGSLAIPLALDGRWTAAAWAMEGAALVWVGIRQHRLLAQIFGVFLQFAAGTAFLVTIDSPVGELPLWNGAWLGSVVVSVSALFSAWFLYRHPESLKKYARIVSMPLLLWGLAWWLGSGLREMNAHLNEVNEAHATLLFMSLTALALGWLGRRIQWPPAILATIALLPVLVLALFGEFAFMQMTHAFQGWGLLAWVVAMAAHMRVLWHGTGAWPVNVLRIWHPLGLWLLVALLTWELDWAIRETVFQSLTWHWIAWALIPGAVVYLLLRFGKNITWPVAKYSVEYLGTGLGMLAIYLWLWAMAAAFHAGDPAPLSYVALLNPMDIAQCFALLAALRWVLWWRKTGINKDLLEFVPLATGGLAAGGFLWLNSVLARAVHFWGDVAWNPDALKHSVLFQTAIAILWTLTAMVVMVVARRRASRRAWYVGAGLLGLVVLKLFMVDLSGAGTLERIISFLVVGGLMLVIGFYSPLPPRSKKEPVS